jgi:putative transposase
VSDEGLFPNDVWEQDSGEAPVYVQLRVQDDDGHWKLKGVKVWGSVVKDTFSRAIVGYALQFGSPDAELSIAALANAMLRNPTPTKPFTGMPRELRVDRGSEHKKRLQEVMARLEIVLTISPPRAPNTRPFIENTFHSLWSMLSGSVGYVHAERGIERREEKRAALYPTMEQFLADFGRIVEDYNHRIHSGTGEAPVERWHRAEHIRTVPSAVAYLLLTKDARLRTVRAEGVEFQGSYYSHLRLRELRGPA